MKRTMLTVVLLGLSLLTATALALPNGYAILRWTVDGGGHTFSYGGGYALGGTIGQPDAMTRPLESGSYVLYGGFWPGGPAPAVGQRYDLFLPLVVRGF